MSFRSGGLLLRSTLILVECFDLPGEGPEDAGLRAALLRAAGFRAHPLWIAPPTPVDPARGPGDRVAIARSHGEARQALLALLASHPGAPVLVASAAPAGGLPATWLPAGRRAHWWPTGIAETTPRGFWTPRPALEPPPGPDPVHPLDWCWPGPLPRSGTSLPLWDGPYLLVPGPLAGRAGEMVLNAFAAQVAGGVAVDLMVLAHPQRRFQERARRLGVGTRIHFAGPAPRGAEWAWLGGAAAVMPCDGAPLPGGLLWRALACGCPVLAWGSRGVGARLREWLDARGLSPGVSEGAAALAAVVARAPRIEAAVARGRALAAAQSPEALGARLAAAFAPGMPDRARAAA